MSTGFEVLRGALVRKAEARESERLAVLRAVEGALDSLGPRYGVEEAYVFGSLLRPGGFGPDSDIDVAVRDLGKRYWAFASELSVLTRREVDVVELERSRFADRIRRGGKKWTSKV